MVGGELAATASNYNRPKAAPPSPHASRATDQLGVSSFDWQQWLITCIRGLRPRYR